MSTQAKIRIAPGVVFNSPGAFVNDSMVEVLDQLRELQRTDRKNVGNSTIQVNRSRTLRDVARGILDPNSLVG